MTNVIVKASSTSVQSQDENHMPEDRYSNCATKHAVNAFSGALLRELVSTPLRVSEVQPGMVETEFSVTRFRGDRKMADSVYEGLHPLTAEDIAEEIVWCAARPPHVNIAEIYVLPKAQASATLSHRQKS
ncbi:hypothetical protein PCANC_22059 [Puccinia coronata f. sp. avenae]|uniref:Uncharacterized protein n=1 Tax=Puccinia coronata f. sp. avenae TaxID=200324 RepID=A0A2N5TNI8_9BASI|nr:hypothetical protein PCANC_22059 [Puccinia coronata f. sp. avenae]